MDFFFKKKKVSMEFNNWAGEKLTDIIDNPKYQLQNDYFLCLKKKVQFVFEVKVLADYAWQDHEISHG